MIIKLKNEIEIDNQKYLIDTFLSETKMKKIAKDISKYMVDLATMSLNEKQMQVASVLIHFVSILKNSTNYPVDDNISLNDIFDLCENINKSSSIFDIILKIFENFSEQDYDKLAEFYEGYFDQKTLLKMHAAYQTKIQEDINGKK